MTTNPRLDRAAEWLYRYVRVTSRAFMPYVRKDAEAMLAAVDGPEPTWRDVKLAARRGGYRVEKVTQFPEEHRRWLITDKDDNHPWHATVRHSDEKGWLITLYGPRGDLHAYPPMHPRLVLDAARVVGLIGGRTDER